MARTATIAGFRRQGVPKRSFSVQGGRTTLNYAPEHVIIPASHEEAQMRLAVFLALALALGAVLIASDPSWATLGIEAP
jgi:hypothetical protein